MDKFKKFLQSKNGKAVVAVVFVIAASICVFELSGFFRISSAAAAANNRVFICSETGRSFNVNLANIGGEAPPIQSPYSGKKTAYPAELCYWTADGKPKSTPTPVLVNQWLGNSDPTFCPDCGRLVVPHNPPAVEGATPPMTKAEWEKSGRRASRAR